MTIRLSVVIPTFNRTKLLRDTIPALANQRVDADVEYEVIYVSNGSTDGTDEMMKDVVAQYAGKFRYFAIAPTGGPSAPRNVGIRNATGDIVILIDDDILPEPDFVQRHAEFHKCHPELHDAAVGYVYVPDRLLDDPVSFYHVFPYQKMKTTENLHYLFFWTSNVSLKRQFMLDYGMFDEKFLSHEDIICGWDLSRHGMNLHLLMAARAEHLHQFDVERMPIKSRWMGRWLYFVARRIPDRELKVQYGILSPEVGWRVYARLAFRRMGFRLLDNPLTIAVLRLIGATRSRRNRITDFYYFLIFRRAWLAGYYEVKRAVESGKRTFYDDPAWQERGD